MNKNPHEWEIDNLPNRLTFFRILLIPVIIGSLFLNLIEYELSFISSRMLGYVAAWTFVAASVTDFFDGYIARKRNIVTVFGSFLDPIADKFLVVSSLIILQGLGRIPVLIVIVLVLREVYITALRLLAIERGISVPVGVLGKWKTMIQMMGIPFLMAFDHPWGLPMPLLGISLIYIACFLSVYSALDYSFSLLKKINVLRKEAKKLRKEGIA